MTTKTTRQVLSQSLQQLLEDPEPGHKHLVSLARWMVQCVGVPGTYRIGYNVAMNGYFVAESLPGVGKDDFVWLCNQLGKARQSVKDNCIDNYRLCHASWRTGDPTAEYAHTRSQGCCGSFDKRVNNPRTGRTFWIGFNYGH